MFNVSGGELLIVLFVALVVLGPQKLPEAARKVGQVIHELRRISGSFQREMKAAMEDPVSKVTGEPTPKSLAEFAAVSEAPSTDTSGLPTGEDDPSTDADSSDGETSTETASSESNGVVEPESSPPSVDPSEIGAELNLGGADVADAMNEKTDDLDPPMYSDR